MITTSMSTTKKLIVIFTFFAFPCPDGYVSHSAKVFHFQNGTLFLGDGERLESNLFCINRVEDKNDSTSNGSFVARYCVPDPCDRPGCIRKCCPSGMAIVTKYYHDQSPINICESHPKLLNLSLLRNPKNETTDLGSFFTRGGLEIKCGDLTMDLYNSSSFVAIDHDGKFFFYSKDDPNGDKTNEYCIDNLVKNETIDIVAFGCVKNVVSVWMFLVVSLKILSVTFLIATFTVYCLLPKMRNIHGVTVMCFLVSMTIQYISYNILDLVRLRVNEIPTGLCHTLAISLRFAQSANLSWLNVMFFGVWRMFYCLKRPAPANTTVLGKQFFYYSLYGWGVPLVIVAVGQILQHNDVPDDLIRPGLASKLHCTFSYECKGPVLAYLYGPIIAMIGANVFMFVWASFNFYRASTESSQVTNVPRKGQRFKVILSLFLLMGVQWLADMIIFFANSERFKISLFIYIYSLFMPPFLFFIFICKPSVWKMLKFKFPRLDPFFSNCEKLASRIFSMISRHHPLTTSEEIPINLELPGRPTLQNQIE